MSASRPEPTAFLHPFTKPTARDFITLVRGEGATVYDDRGNAYVDALASLWYCNVGHGRREIAEAVAEQMTQLAAFHTFERFTNPPAEQLCARLAELSPITEARVFLTDSGSEAVDSAFKLARAAHDLAGDRERTVIISRRPSYHGVTYGATSATGLPANQAHFGPLLPDVVQTPHNDLSAVEAAFDEHPGRVAAVIAEPVVGAGGVYPPAPGYLQGLRDLCDAHGAFLIFDEVVCGFGRLGHWWGAQHFGVRPDMATFAKAVTSGYLPLGGVLVGPVVRRRLEADPEFILKHGHTYSGHPTVCAAAMANLDIIEREGLPDNAVKIGQRLGAGLQALADEGRVVEARGEGAIWAVQLHEGVPAQAIREEMLTRGVIPRPVGDSVVAFCPPLVIGDADVDRCVEALADSLG